MTMPGTPSQTVGPFFAPALGPGRTDLTGDGERIAIAGRVLDGDGKAVPDAMLEIWQADAQGRYGGEGFFGFGRALTGAQGEYRFTTIKPGRVPGPGGALQAPHVCLTIFARGLLRQLSTRIYFAGDPANETDPVLASISDPSVRRTLLARAESGPREYRFDVVLQGENETAFFDL
ncbi:MAG TPA: protocatechuate 3,4-dioxygenase subunit alpha [Myxococcales bacterium]